MAEAVLGMRYLTFGILMIGLICRLQLAHAFPTGAGDCPGGRAAVGGTHVGPATSITVTTGTLEDNQLQMRISGQVLQPNATLFLQSGVEQAWELSTAADVGFRGFLVRLGATSDEIDTTVALSSVSEGVQEAYAACVLAQGVGGMTHTDNNPKAAVSGILRLDEISTGLQLDVTVVIQNSNRESIYYYSAYTIGFQEEPIEGQPTATFSPTALPTTAPPSNVPTPAPTTASPTIATPDPTNRQTAPPTVAPTMTPPTQIPGATPDPTNVQTAPPNEVPTVMPTTETPGATPVPDTNSPSQQPTTTAPTASPQLTTASPTSTPSLRPVTFAPSLQPATDTLEPTATITIGENSRDDFTILNTNDLLSLVDMDDCSANSPCEKCQGDCNDDTDCAGDLECYRRPGNYGTPIPGCQGQGTLGYDYCYEPSSSVLRLRTPFCSPLNPCDRCEGDCNGDEDCQEGLKCFERSYLETTMVPGCNNLGIGAIPFPQRQHWTGLDYCYDPNMELGDDVMPTEMNDCDTDDDCRPIACFEEPCTSFVCRDSQCTFVERCGSNECANHEYCCNESCNLCVPKGAYCSLGACERIAASDDDLIEEAEKHGKKDDKKGKAKDESGSESEDSDSDDDEDGGFKSNDEGVEQTDSADGIVFCEADEECRAPACPEEPCKKSICVNSQCTLVEECGRTDCGPDEFCCNESCSICEPVGGSCPLVQCPSCGGEVCGVGEICCNPGCEICMPPGGSCPEICTTLDAGEDGNMEEDSACETDNDCPSLECIGEPCLSYVCRDSTCSIVEQCGRKLCDLGEFCCNEECSLCATRGDTCSQEPCEVCGDEICNQGDSCCHEECSICRAPGGSCPDICNPYWFLPAWKTSIAPTESPTVTFATNVPTKNPTLLVGGEKEACITDEECASSYWCTEEPCPVFECRDFRCQSAQPDEALVECEVTLDCPIFICFDEQCPQIECRENKCLLFIPCGEIRCEEDEVCCCGACNPKDTVCDESCVPCGPGFCPQDEVCCNESCSICTPPGGFCTAQFCFDDDEETDDAIVVAAALEGGDN